MALADATPVTPQWTLGDRLAKARRAANISQKEMAAKFGVTQGAVSAWENDVRQPHDLIEFIDRWSEATGAPQVWLLGYSDRQYILTAVELEHGEQMQLALDAEPPNLSAL